MLDAKELAARIRRAMDDAKPKVTSAAVATRCDVSPQAVYEWRRTGRVAKRHLMTLSELTGKPLPYFLGSDATPSELVDPRANRLVEMFHYLTEKEKQTLLHEIEAMSEGNKAIAKEIGRKLNPVSDDRVEEAINGKKKKQKKGK